MCLLEKWVKEQQNENNMSEYYEIKNLKDWMEDFSEGLIHDDWHRKYFNWEEFLKDLTDETHFSLLEIDDDLNAKEIGRDSITHDIVENPSNYWAVNWL
jgi:hypothetical protein